MAFKMDAGRGNYAKTGKGVPSVLRQDPPVDPKSGLTLENIQEGMQALRTAGSKTAKAKNIKSPKEKSFGQKLSSFYHAAFPEPRGGYRPIIKDGKINFDFSRMDDVMTGLDD